MVFLEKATLEDFVETPREEIEPPKKSNFRKNLMNIIMGVGLFGIVGHGAYSYFKEIPKVQETNPLENYSCVENIKTKWEENLETYANHIVWENPDKKFAKDEVLKFLIRFNGELNEKIKAKEDIVIPVYSTQVCRRLDLPEN